MEKAASKTKEKLVKPAALHPRVSNSNHQASTTSQTSFLQGPIEQKFNAIYIYTHTYIYIEREVPTRSSLTPPTP